METLSRLEAQILAYLLERLPISTRGRCWACPLPGSASGEVVAAAPLAAVPGTSAIFTLARATPRVALTVTAADDPVRVGAILARAAHGAPAGVGTHVAGLEDAYLAAHGRTGVALLPPSCGRWFPGVPDAVRFDADVILVSMATFLSPSELADLRARGAEPLLAAFGRGERDLTRFGSRERAG